VLETGWTKAVALAAAFVIAATATGGILRSGPAAAFFAAESPDLNVQLLDRYRGGVRAIRRLERVNYIGGS